uniref:UDP-glucose/GDP-mannose dehydrogenase N-terminal domain-containing protein n=1 Tax=Ignisphaera aggregans TaxID=334771 RepID=A0A7J3Z7T8_9CREN
MKKICVIGLGYVGLLAAVVFASRGFSVIGVDVDVKKVEAVNNGKCYLRETGLDSLLRDDVSKGFLRATTDAVEAVRESDAVITAMLTSVKEDVANLLYFY